ncbi:MAG: CCA tRNA nucleotidyltransferase, partial [Phormidesmis sp.]
MYSLFLPKTWPFPIKLLPQNAYLVGGSVRDQLLQRQPSYLDLDFVLSHKAVETAWNLSQKCNAGFVVLDEARQIARVVFDRATVDFAQQQGDSLEADLRRRDFTINAIAYHPLSQTLVDPLGGKDDIATQTLRMVSPENLAADPLRLMRAYRQAAQLGFTIEERTQQTIGDLAPKLQQVAIERVSSELDGLLSVPAGTAKLEAILQQRLLQFCLPHFTAQSIRQIEAIDGAIAQLKNLLPDYADSLEAWLEPVAAGFHRSWIKATKLSRLLARESA